MIFQLKSLPKKNIDPKKWDKCVFDNKALIYCKKQYLDIMADEWFGIVLNDYEAIMPICIKQKFGIRYGYTPAFVQQLGLIGINKLTTTNELLIALKKEILNIARYGDIQFNYKNLFATTFCETKTNFIIDLKNNYEYIFTHYKNDLKQNLKKTAKEEFIYTTTSDVEFAVDTYKNTYGERMLNISNSDYLNFKKLCTQLATTNNCIVRQVLNKQQEVLAIALLLVDENRIYNIANSNTALGRATEANHFLIDNILQEFAGSGLTFDFEGSDLPGVKQFYQKFGALNEPYYHWHFNELPWWIKWLKK
jgi:hypothetical protein